MINQVEYAEKTFALYGKMKEVMPAVSGLYEGVKGQVYKDGALSLKFKRLMSLAIAIKTDCQGCIVSQAKHALDLGASVEEIYETCEVAISMGGSTAQSNALVVIQYLEELKKI